MLLQSLVLVASGAEPPSLPVYVSDAGERTEIEEVWNTSEAGAGPGDIDEPGTCDLAPEPERHA